MTFSPLIQVPLSFVQLVDEAGTPVLIPSISYASRFAGQEVITLKLRSLAQPTTDQPDTWLTVKQATLLHLSDVDGLTFNQAKMRVIRAAERGAFRSLGQGRSRRYEPATFAAWRLRQQQLNFREEDDTP